MPKPKTHKRKRQRQERELQKAMDAAFLEPVKVWARFSDTLDTETLKPGLRKVYMSALREGIANKHLFDMGIKDANDDDTGVP